jgi:hypothetical protein
MLLSYVLTVDALSATNAIVAVSGLTAAQSIEICLAPLGSLVCVVAMMLVSCE